MKTAVLMNKDFVNHSSFSITTNNSLTERNELQFIKFKVDEASDSYINRVRHEISSNNITIKHNTCDNTIGNNNTFSYIHNPFLSSKAAKVFSIIPFLYSLRCYFRKKINIYFCDKCLAYFKKVILLEETEVCDNCVNSVTYNNHLQISEFFNIFYSIVYPFEPNAFIMGCLCKIPVLKQCRYIECDCLFFHKHVDHNNILKTIFRFEKKLWKKLFYLSFLIRSLHGNISNILQKVYKYRNIHMLTKLPLQKVILNREVQALQILFHQSCNYLYELWRNDSHLNIKQNVDEHLKGFIHICNSKKIILSKFKYFFRDFVLFFDKVLMIRSLKESCTHEKIKRKDILSCNEYSDLMLIFGFYFYFLNILKFCKEKSIFLSKLLLIFIEKCKKKHMIHVIFKIYDMYNCQLSNNSEKITFLKNNVQEHIDLEHSCLNVNILCPNEDKEMKYEVAINKFIQKSIQSQDVQENQRSIIKKNTVCGCSHNSKNCLCQSESYINLDNNLKKTMLSNPNAIQFSNTVTTGKEEVDVIDGINIYSFETESDMMEFTIIQAKDILKKSDSDILSCSKSASFGRIIPTKTCDITKIKGWRNKLFFTDENDKNRMNHYKIIPINPAKSNQISNSKATNYKFKQEPLNLRFQMKEELQENSSEVNLEAENDDIKIKEEPLKFDNFEINHENDFKKSECDIKLPHLQVLSENMIPKSQTKQINEVNINQGIFQSSLLDAFLQNHSKLKVNVDIYNSCNSPIPSFHNKKTKSLHHLESKKSNNCYCKAKEAAEYKSVDFSSIDFIKNMQGDTSKRKYMWVHGRPIILEHENKKTVTNNISKKRSVANLENTLRESINCEDYLKKIKITEPLNSSGTLHLEKEYFEFNEEFQTKNKTNKPYLSLLNTVKLNKVDEKFGLHGEILAKQKFPLIFPCTSGNNNHNECAKFAKIQLGMVINIGYKRPFLKEVINNVEQLKKDVGIIDSLWANIAASAVCPKRNEKKVKRYLVPVVSNSLIEVVKFNIENVSTNISNINELNVHSVYSSICASDTCRDITDTDKCEIKDVVDNIIDYVVKRDQYESMKIPYDPDIPNPTLNIKIPIKKVKKSKVERELKRLINVTLVDDWRGTDETNTTRDSCGNEHCAKGCVCYSLNGKLTILHCGKLDCMFECSCDHKANYSFNSSMHRRNRVVLAKEESSWHQTVICKNNEIIEIKAESGKSKREKKLPTRFRNNVLLGKEMNCLDLSPSLVAFENSKKLYTSKLSPINKDKDLKNKDKCFKLKEKDKELKNKEKDYNNKDTRLKNKETELENKEKDYKNKDTRLKNKETELKNKEKDYKTKDTRLKNKETELKNKEKDYKNKDTRLKNKETELKNKEKDYKNKDTRLKNKETELKNKGKELQSKDSEIKIHELELNNKDEVIKNLELQNKEKELDNKDDDPKLENISGNKNKPMLKTTMKKVHTKPKATTAPHLKQSLNKTDLKKMAKICREVPNNLLTITDVFVWCSIHFRYSCSCSGQIFIVKHNRLVWKPLANKNHINSKLKPSVLIESSTPKYHLFDHNCNSARTFGSIFNYKLRNSSPVFKSKRLNEVANGVLSNTNSFIKIDFAALESSSTKKIQMLQKLEKVQLSMATSSLNKISLKLGYSKIVNKQLKQSPTLKSNVALTTKKQKRSVAQSEDIKLLYNMPATHVMEDYKYDNIKNKKKYRIGPAHFDSKGNYRAIGNHIPSKNVNKCQSNEDRAFNSINKEIISSYNINDTTKENEEKFLPKYGLLCLTQGFGYLPVKEFTQKKLQVQDPLSEHVFHCFKDINSANKWLNRFFKNRIVFESLDVNLKWVIVKPGILKQSQPFDKSLVENSSKIVNKDGILVEKLNINGCSFNQHLEESSLSQCQQVNDQKLIKRSLDEVNENNQDSEDIPLKKLKMSSSTLRQDTAFLNHGMRKVQPIKKTIGGLQLINQQEIACARIDKKPSINNEPNNHSTFFRLNNKSDSTVSEGCFIPLVPAITSNEHFRLQNVNGNKKLTADILGSSSSSSHTSLNVIKSNSSVKKNLLINHLGKIVPLNIKTLPRKSILKTKLK